MQNNTQEPLDLSSIDMSDSASAAKGISVTQEPTQREVTSLTPALEIEAMGEPPRLVETKNMGDAELNQAHARSNAMNFTNSRSLLKLGEKSLESLASVAKSLLANRTISQTGEVGEIASSVLAGIKVLRLEDLQNEINEKSGPVRKSFVGKLMEVVAREKTAIQGFAQNKKKFITLMNEQESKSRAYKGTLTVDIELIERMSQSARSGVTELKLDIAAAQIAIERGYREAETLRAKAISSGEPVDASYYMDFRSNIKMLEAKAMELRTALLRAATLIPTISSTRQAAETRIMKIDNGLLLVIPSLMSAAALAATHADIRNSERDSQSLEAADRAVLKLASQGAHDVATSAARSNVVDQRNIDALAESARTAIQTLTDVLDIENEVGENNRKAEQQLIQIRDGLVVGMQGVQYKALNQI